MRIEVDGIEYAVAMQWLPNDDIHYFLILDDDNIPLDLQLHKERYDVVKHLTHHDVRTHLANEIRQYLDSRSNYRRA
jgi:hypothetical protein